MVITSVYSLYGRHSGYDKIFKTILSGIFPEFLHVTATQIIVHHSINLMRFKNPSKRSTFNKGIRSGKSFSTIEVTVYPVGATTNCKWIFLHYRPYLT